MIADGVWGHWTENFACNAACESEGIEGEIRTCSEPQVGGEECTRGDQTQTTPENRLETKEIACENIMPCPGL